MKFDIEVRFTTVGGRGSLRRFLIDSIDADAAIEEAFELTRGMPECGYIRTGVADAVHGERGAA